MERNIERMEDDVTDGPSGPTTLNHTTERQREVHDLLMQKIDGVHQRLKTNTLLSTDAFHALQDKLDDIHALLANPEQRPHRDNATTPEERPLDALDTPTRLPTPPPTLHSSTISYASSSSSPLLAATALTMPSLESIEVHEKIGPSVGLSRRVNTTAQGRVQDAGTQVSDEALLLVADESKAVLSRVSRLVTELRRRHEELKSIQDDALTEVDSARRRIVELEAETERLASDSFLYSSELLQLKIRLKVMEAQATPYIPEDDDLAEDIRRWKLDWREVDQRYRSRRIGQRDNGTIAGTWAGA
ncbi:MAG: hypothetical protein M1817_001502 [Caeruleum heppii]|nr:MAG: hypothetical protein M1817_001502 [Caeruleum heppii]